MATRVLAFVGMIALAAVCSLLALFQMDRSIDLALIGGSCSFVVLGVIAQFVGYRLQGSTFGAISFIPFMTSILLYPSWVSVMFVALGAVIAEFNRKKHTVKRVFNIAQQIMSASLAVYVFTLLGGKSLQVDETVRPLAEAGAVIAFLVVNTLAVASVVALSEGRNLLVVWYHNIIGSLVYDIMAIPFVHAFALVYAHFHYVGVGFVLFALYGARQLYHTKIQLEKFNKELLEVLVHTVEMRDPYTSGHSQRVSRYSRIIARSLGLSKKQVDRIEIAALLHDVGKIHEIFATILPKPGRLTPEERAIMELHPIKSVELVEKVSELEDILPAIRHHHENWDGTGYPDRIAGKAIPLGSRIIMFADTIDAMTTDRPYRAALGEAEVRTELLKHRGKQFDPEILDILLASPHYPLLFSGADGRWTPIITHVFGVDRIKRVAAVA